MKIKKIGALCKAAGRCLLFDELSPEGEIVRQWISNGWAMWPVSGLPQLREANLSTLFDFSPNAVEKIRIEEKEMPGKFCEFLHDLRDGERELTESSVRIRVYGEELMALTTGPDVIWLKASLLAPCWTKETRLAARGGYVAALDGLFLSGIILPTVMQDEFYRELLRLSVSAPKPMKPAEDLPEEDEDDDAG